MFEFERYGGSNVVGGDVDEEVRDTDAGLFRFREGAGGQGGAEETREPDGGRRGTRRGCVSLLKKSGQQAQGGNHDSEVCRNDGHEVKRHR